MSLKDLKEFQEEPLQIITVNEDGILEITIEGINFFNKLNNEKLSILSINGIPESGKSFLGNSLIGKMKGFKCENTKGLWVWGKPINLENGSKLLIFDSQGLNKKDRDSISQKIYILNILISNYIIYNTKGEVNDEILKDFILFSDLSKGIFVSEQNKKENTIENLSNYYPSLIWTLSNYFNEEKKPDDYLQELLSKNPNSENIKKLFLRRKMFYIPNPTSDKEKFKNLQNEDLSILSEDYKNAINNLLNEIKDNIPYKKVNDVQIDGDTLFGILQNYIDTLNNDEKPIISQAIDNVLLSRGKSISEKCFEDFKNEFNKRLENKFPMNINEIYKIFFEIQDKTIKKFSNEVKTLLNPKSSGDYILNMNERMHSELENVFETNNEYYNEFINMEYNGLKKNLSDMKFTNLEEAKTFFYTYSKSFEYNFKKFLNIPNPDFCKNLLIVINDIFDNFVTKKLSEIGDEIGKISENVSKTTSSDMNNLNYEIKKLNDQFDNSKNLVENLQNEKSELTRNYLELNNRYDKLSRDANLKDKEYKDKEFIYNQKYQQMENHYMGEIREKENIISEQKLNIEKLNKDISISIQENSNKINELNREISKLNIENQKLKEEKNQKNDGPVINQTIFKNIQSTFMEFKESLDKLGKENDNLLNQKQIENETKEIKNKANTWIEEIKNFKEAQFKSMNDLYEENYKKVQNQVNELKLELTQKEVNLTEQTHLKDSFETKYNEANKQIEELFNISKSKDNLISTQNDAIKMYEEQIGQYKRTKEDYELSLNKYIVNFKMKEDEIEYIMGAIEGIITKKKDKFEYNAKRLSVETNSQIYNIIKNYNFKFK